MALQMEVMKQLVSGQPQPTPTLRIVHNTAPAAPAPAPSPTLRIVTNTTKPSVPVQTVVPGRPAPVVGKTPAAPARPAWVPWAIGLVAVGAVAGVVIYLRQH